MTAGGGGGGAPHDVGGEVGVCSSSVTSGDHLHHGHNLAGQADLGEAHVCSQLAYLLLVLREQEGMLQTHRQAGDALVQHLLPNSRIALLQSLVALGF